MIDKIQLPFSMRKVEKALKRSKNDNNTKLPVTLSGGKGLMSKSSLFFSLPIWKDSMWHTWNNSLPPIYSSNYLMIYLSTHKLFS